MTEPAARGTFSATVTQWAIYDAYEEERLGNQGISTSATQSLGSGGPTTSVGGGTTAANSVSTIAKPADTSKVLFTP